MKTLLKHIEPWEREVGDGALTGINRDTQGHFRYVVAARKWPLHFDYSYQQNPRDGSWRSRIVIHRNPRNPPERLCRAINRELATRHRPMPFPPLTRQFPMERPPMDWIDVFWTTVCFLFWMLPLGWLVVTHL